jgi:hypothetical protein
MVEERRSRGRPRKQAAAEEDGGGSRADEYSSMTVVELRSACSDAGIDATGVCVCARALSS